MSQPVPGRQSGRPLPKRTRWLLVTPLIALAGVIGFVVWLEGLHPQIDPGESGLNLVVEGVPPLAVEGARACLRRADEGDVEAIRAAIPPAGRVSSTQVYACPMAFDGLQVSFAGEIVGELLPRAGGVWAQVNDDDYAFEVGPVIGHREHRGFNTGMSVWLPDGLHDQLDDVGRPGMRGDVIVVTGTLHQSDPDDGGGITVRASSLEVLAPAVGIDAPLHLLQVVIAIALAIIAAATVAWSRWTRNR
ncbi:MAG: hypothetical protein WD358_00675 [Nitriliruptoraceae bacterium]